MRGAKKLTPEKSCLESIPFAVIECTERTVYDANRSARRIFGHGNEFPVPFNVFFGKDASPLIRSYLRDKIPSGRGVLHEKKKVYDLRVVKSANGGNRRFLCLNDVTDIFGRIEKEKASAEVFQTIVDNSEDGISIVYNGVFKFVNEKFKELFGFKNEKELIGKPIAEIILPEDRERVLSHSNARQKGESTPLMYDYRGVRQNGEIIDIEVVASRIDFEGESASLSFHRNVTDKKVLEKKLTDSEGFRRNIFSSIDQGIAVFDSSLQCRDWNHQMRHFTGIGPETALGARATKLLGKFKDYGALDKFENVLKGAKVSFGYLPYLHPLSRQMRYAWLNLSPLLDSNGSVSGIVGVLSDLTHQKFMQDEIKESETLFRNVLEAMGDALVLTDLQGKVLRVNKEFERITGYMESEAVGQAIPYSWFYEPDTSRFLLWISELREKNYLHDFDIRWESKSGEIIPVSLNTTLLKNKEGDPVAMLNIARDITDRKKLEVELKSRTQQIEMINRVISKANETIEIKDLLFTLDSELRNLIEFERFGIILLKEFDETDEVVFSRTHKGKKSVSETLKGPGTSLGTSIREWDSPFTSNDLCSETAVMADLPIVRAGYHSLAAVPIHSKDTFLGVLYIANREPRCFLGNETLILQPICEQLGLIVEKLNLFTRVRDDAIYIHNLLNSMDDMVFTVDTELIVTENNSPAAGFPFIDKKMIKNRGNSLVGLPLHTILKKTPYREGLDQIVEALFSEQLSVYITEFSFSVGGEEKNFQLRINPMKIEGGIVGLVFTHTDISALKKTEAELKKRNKDLIELNEISALLTKSTDLTDVYNISLNKVKEMFDASFVNVYLISGKRAELSGYAGEFTDDELESIRNIDLMRSVMGEVFQSKAPVIIPRELSVYQSVSAPWGKLIKKYNLQAGVNLPLIIQEKVLGTFNINFNYPRELSDQEIQFLALITNQLSAAIENTRLYENLRERMNDLTILASLGTIYASSLDINELTESVLDRINELRGPDTMVLTLFNDKSSMMQVVSSRGIPDGVYDYSVDELHPAVRNILETKQDMIIEDINAEYPDLKEILISRDQNSIGFFTLQAEGVLLGLLSVGFRRASKFPLEDVALYKSIATQLSMAIRNAQLYQQIQDSEEKYRLLIETAQDMVISMELDGTFTYISPSAEYLTGYSPQELLSHRLSPRMIHPSDFQYVNKLIRLAASQETPMGASREVEFRIRIRSGGYRWISASYTLVHDARGNITGVQCILRDVHERRLAQEEITQQLHQQRVLYELAHDLAATLERKEILSAVAKSIHKILPYHMLTVYNYNANLPDEMQRIMTVSAGNGAVIFDKPVTIPLGFEELGLERRVLRDRCLCEGRVPGKDIYRIAAPLLIKDQAFGLLVIEAYQKKEYSEVQKNLLQTIAHLASIAVEKSLLYEETVDKSLEIERRNRELDDFTYVVSHDLKEPLISIEGYSKILLADFNDSLRAEGQDLLASIRQSSIRMKKLINELLELSRVGRMTESMKSVDINDILDEILEDLEYTINKRNVGFEIPAGIPAVHGNRVHLVLLFRNLIVNAIKFNESPNPKISIGWRAEDNMYRFHVADNGIGIPEEYFEKIFIIFHKLRSQINLEGTGAGLTIVKKIIETHGGRIWLDSTVGKGTTFYFTLQKEKR